VRLAARIVGSALTRGFPPGGPMTSELVPKKRIGKEGGRGRESSEGRAGFIVRRRLGRRGEDAKPDQGGSNRKW
jgi:hypothetical protein